jgi:hypothetical protein
MPTNKPDPSALHPSTPVLGARTGEPSPRSPAGRRFDALSTVLFLSPLATSITPRLTPLFVVLAAATLIIPAWRAGMRWSELLPRQAALFTSLLFAAYVSINAFWSADPLAGFSKAALLVALILVTFAAVTAAGSLDRAALVRAGVAFAAGSLLGALFVMLELITGGIVTRTFVGWFPALASPKHFLIEGGKIVSIRLSKLDQNVNLALFHLWPGMLALLCLAGPRRVLAGTLLFLVIAAVIALSEHDSSQVALLLSSLLVLAALKWRAQVVRALAVLWCAAFVLVLPASFLAYDNGLHFAEWLPKSARARVILWQYTAEQTLARPLLGVGVESTPALRARQKKVFGSTRPKDFVYPRTMGHHSHNIFLQSWYELGAVGAALLAVAGAAVALLILLLPAAAQPYAAGAFAAFGIVGAFAWGMWQSWFMCAVALLPIYLRVGANSITNRGETSAWPATSRHPSAEGIPQAPH